MTRKEQREKRRQDIMVAALDIFIRKGYSGAKIQDIAQAVGMSVGLLFNYFESKEKLYEELIKLGITHPKTMLENIEGDPKYNTEQGAFQDVFFSLAKSANIRFKIRQHPKIHSYYSQKFNILFTIC